MLWISSTAIGVSCCLLACVVSTLGWRAFSAGKGEGDRSFFMWLARRQGAAGGEGLLRMAWPGAGLLRAWAGRVLPGAGKRMLDRRIAAAGLDSAHWTAGHVLALQIAGFAWCAVLSLLIAWGGLGQGFASSLGVAMLMGLLAAWWPYQRLRERARKRQAHILREMPFMLDMATLCVEAGQNLQGALQQAARHGPPGPLRSELQLALSDMRAGMPRARALQAMAARSGLPALHSLVALIVQAEQMGMSIGPLLRAQAGQRRAERFLRAEKLALEAPVKMLFPLITCIFPCSFLIIAFPIGFRLLHAGF